MSNKGNQDNTEVWILLGCVAIVAGSMAYNYYQAEIAEVWRWVRVAQLSLFYWVPTWVPIFGELRFADMVNYLLITPGEMITPKFMTDLDQLYGRHLSWIPVVILGLLAFKLISKVENVSMVYTMESMLKDRARLYPFLARFLEKDPVPMQLKYTRGTKESKEFGIALTPADFSTMSPPLGLEKEARKNKLFKQPIWDKGVDFDRDLAERAFKKQLGRHFKGMDSLNATERRLFDELKGRVKVDDGEVEEFIRKAMKAAMSNKTDGFSSTEKKIIELIKLKFAKDIKRASASKDVVNSKNVASAFADKDINKQLCVRKSELVMESHAFIRVGLMSLLEVARGSGVVPSLEFQHWLKSEDRILWYCMSSVGRRVSFVESAGPFAHWLLEKEIGRPVTQGFVDEAVEGLYIALRMEERIRNHNEKMKNEE